MYLEAIRHNFFCLNLCQGCQLRSDQSQPIALWLALIKQRQKSRTEICVTTRLNIHSMAKISRRNFISQWNFLLRPILKNICKREIRCYFNTYYSNGLLASFCARVYFTAFPTSIKHVFTVLGICKARIPEFTSRSQSCISMNFIASRSDERYTKSRTIKCNRVCQID